MNHQKPFSSYDDVINSKGCVDEKEIKFFQRKK